LKRNDAIHELEAAEVFVQVTKAQGFTQAARVLGRSASRLSRIVAALEAHLGAQLLVRTTRQVRLTEAGALYLQHAEGMLTARRAAHDALAELSGGGPKGLLRVSMPVVVGERLLAPRLNDFCTQYPSLRLEIDLSDRNIPIVEEGFDLAVRVGLLPDSALRALPLGVVPARLVASPSLIAKLGQPTCPADLSGWPCVTVGYASGNIDWTLWPKARDHTGARGRSEQVRAQGIIHTTSPSLAAQAAVMGLGALRTTEWVVRQELERGSLVELLPHWSCDHPRYGGVPVSVLYAQSAGVEPPLKSKVFVALLRQIMAQVKAGEP
jgi:DNA-binding transcriptional LysR family regulator